MEQSHNNNRSKKRKRQNVKGSIGEQKKHEDEPKTTKGLRIPSIVKVTNELSNIDFLEISSEYPEFKEEWEKLKSRQKERSKQQSSSSSFGSNVDFHFNLALSRAILDKYFQLNLKSLPEGYLCPPIPNRLNYVLWMKQLLKESSSREYFTEPRAIFRKGVDLGTGASCIYPLLLSTNTFTDGQEWKILGTDIDEKAIQSAKENIAANDLETIIKVIKVLPTPNGGGSRTLTRNDEGDIITTPVNTAIMEGSPFCNQIDFCLTNPPFYSSDNEATDVRSGDDRERTSMTSNESVYPGGEIGFALDMIYDSYRHQNKCTWFSLMLSKKSSLRFLQKEVEKVLQLGRGSVRISEFTQGQMVRWGLAWTFLSPELTSPAMKMEGGVSFQVKIETDDRDAALAEVSTRIKVFAKELKFLCLKCEEVSRSEILLSEQKQDVQDTRKSFEARATVRLILKTGSSVEDDYFFVDVYPQFFSSRHDTTKLHKLEALLVGEVQRSNRRWKRLQKKSQLK